MSSPAENLIAVLDRIRQAERRFQRQPGSVTLLAVSKGQPAAAIAARVVIIGLARITDKIAEYTFKLNRPRTRYVQLFALPELAASEAAT